ncbi:hypothetical protein BC830DRAFT_574163 [Chytriomyces sp. MP71]|nr:hypothetical protein BC830DRAFT_574163 [Chytriomyces sp. MP71]
MFRATCSVRPIAALAKPRSGHAFQHRVYSASANELDHAFHAAADARLHSLLDDLDAIGEQCEAPGFDVVFSNGVLTLNTGIAGTYVINKQPPNRQIWLSSPISGPKRFDHIEGAWVDSKRTDKLDELLQREFSTIFKGIEINLSK